MAGKPIDYNAEYIPPPSYRKQTTAEFEQELNKHTSPLRGLAVDPAYPPSKEDAERVLQRMRKESQEKSLVENDPRPTFSATDGERTVNPYRSSGASQIFNKAPTTSEVINTMPGGMAHAAGSGQNMKNAEEVPEATFSNALKTFQPSDFTLTGFYKIPCVREAMMQGGPAGAVVGGISWIIQRPFWTCLNWTVGPFMAVTIAGYQYCQVQRGKERQGMKAAVKIMEEKNEEKRKRREEIMAQRRKEREEEEARRQAQEERLERKRNGRIWVGFWAGRPGEREG